MLTPKKGKKINLFSRLYCRLAIYFNKRENGRIIKFINKRAEKRSKREKEYDEYLKSLPFDPLDKWTTGGKNGVFSEDPKNLYRFM